MRQGDQRGQYICILCIIYSFRILHILIICSLRILDVFLNFFIFCVLMYSSLSASTSTSTVLVLTLVLLLVLVLVLQG